MLTEHFRHLDLKEVAARVEPAAQKHSARGKTYVKTEPGMADQAVAVTAYLLTQVWKADGSKSVRMADLEPDLKQWPGEDGVRRLAASLKRLGRMKQIKLDFDREGVIVTPGPAWIET